MTLSGIPIIRFHRLTMIKSTSDARTRSTVDVQNTDRNSQSFMSFWKTMIPTAPKADWTTLEYVM